MHIHLGIVGLTLLVIAILLIPVYGWGFLLGLVLWPAMLFVMAGALWYGVRQIGRQHEQRQQEALATRRRIAQLEAEQGIPLVTEGTCPQCGKPLLAGAHFCSYCKTPTARTALVCAVCGTRNAGDAIWCGACGAPLADDDAELMPRRHGSGSTRIATFLDSALER